MLIAQRFSMTFLPANAGSYKPDTEADLFAPCAGTTAARSPITTHVLDTSMGRPAPGNLPLHSANSIPQ